MGEMKAARHVIDPTYFDLNTDSNFDLDLNPDLRSHWDPSKTVGGKFLRK